jgi:nitrite reductase/ring-hydroxylating ferredoxin subunit
MSTDLIDLGDASDIAEEETLLRRVGEVAVCLYNVRGNIYATANVCTHGEASLADGIIVDVDQIECPFHQGRFHIPTGKAIHPPCTRDIKTYEVVVQNGRVYLRANDFADEPSGPLD